MTNPNHTDTSRSGDLVEDDFAPLWDESILLAEHEAVQASVAVGGWLSAALDDPNVCDAMKADINRWFSAGFLYLNEVRKLMQTEREALEAENERLLDALFDAVALIGHVVPMNTTALVGGERLTALNVWHAGYDLLFPKRKARAELERIADE